MNFVIFPLFFFSGALYPAEPAARLDAAAGPPQPAHLRGRPDAPDAARTASATCSPRPSSTPASTSPSSVAFSIVCLALAVEAVRPRRAPGADDARRRVQTLALPISFPVDGDRLRRPQRLADPRRPRALRERAGGRPPRPAADGRGGDARRDLRGLHPQPGNRRLQAARVEPAGRRRAGAGTRPRLRAAPPRPRRPGACWRSSGRGRCASGGRSPTSTRRPRAGPPVGVLHLEGAEPIDADLESLDLWYAAGLRSLGPVWSRPNAFGNGVRFRYPATPDIGPGLTDAGKALVRRCAELGIVFDLAHMNEAGFWDAAEIGRRAARRQPRRRPRDLPQLAQPHRRPDRRGRRHRRPGRHRLRPRLPAPRRQEPDRHPARPDPPPRPPHRRPDRRRARRPRLRLRRHRGPRRPRRRHRPAPPPRRVLQARLQRRRDRADRLGQLAPHPGALLERSLSKRSTIAIRARAKGAGSRSPRTASCWE